MLEILDGQKLNLELKDQMGIRLSIYIPGLNENEEGQWADLILVKNIRFNAERRRLIANLKLLQVAFNLLQQTPEEKHNG